MGLFSSRGSDARNERELRSARGHLARHERELRDRTAKRGRGEDSTTRRIRADIESSHRAIRLFGGK